MYGDSLLKPSWTAYCKSTYCGTPIHKWPRDTNLHLKWIFCKMLRGWSGDMRLLGPLCLCLCITQCLAFQCSNSPYTTQIPEYTICPTENETHKPYDGSTLTEVCDYVSTLPVATCDVLDTPYPASVCWRVLDSSLGSVQVTFPLLSTHCNFTRYDIHLMVYESTECPLSTQNDQFKRHSRKEISVRDCTDSACLNTCSKRATLIFHHVFSGCYQLYVTPQRNYAALKRMVSDPLSISTQHNKTSLDLLTPVVNLGHDNTDLTLKVMFTVTPASARFTLSQGIDLTLGQHACRRSGKYFASCLTCLGSPEIQCQQESSEMISLNTCSYQGESVVRCSFQGVKPGNYCVRIHYDDDRCLANTIWNEDFEDNNSPCTWDTFEQLQPAAVSIIDIEVPLDPHMDPALLVFLALAIIVTCSVVGLVLYHRMIPSSYPQFLPVRHKTTQLTDRQTVLLLYARDCPAFMQAVVHLRNVMRKVYNCQVVDCWEDAQYRAVAAGPGRWLQAHLTDPRVRTVLVTSPASLVQEAALVHARPVHYSQPRAFDSVLTHALSILHETPHHNYKRLFIVRLDVGNESPFPKTRTYLNPLTTYMLPIHLNKLLANLHSLDSSMCIMTTDSQVEVALLSEAISQYRQYLCKNPEYLQTLLVSETNCTLQDILALTVS